MTPEEWEIWKRINARPAKALAAYPDLERQDFDETLDQSAAAAALRPVPILKSRCRSAQQMTRPPCRSLTR
jgi:hypothetical protein